MTGIVLTFLCGVASAQDLKSSWLELNGGGLFGEPGGKPQLMLTLRNKTDRAEWVRVRVAAPAPNAECVLVETIAPGQNVSYRCIQDKLVPDTDYPIFITTFRDESLSDEAETVQTTMRFSKRDTAAFEDFLTPPTIPATFRDLNSSEKLNMGTALFGGMGRAQGVLVVEESGLHYSVKDKVTDIPVSQIRSATVRQMGRDDSQRWVVVEYSDGATTRTLGFQGSMLRGGGPRIGEIHKAVSYVLSKHSAEAAAK
jgi:hypothetical protein